MTGSDLIVVAPWIIFGVCLAVLCIRVLCGRRPASKSPAGKRRHHDKPRA